MTSIQLMFLLNACIGQDQSPESLTNSIWEKKGEFCSDSLHFYANGEYQEYYCEFLEHVNGRYTVNADTLTLIEYQLSSEIIAENPKKVPTYIWKYQFLKKDVLQKIYYEDIISKEKVPGTKTTWKYFMVK